MINDMFKEFRKPIIIAKAIGISFSGVKVVYNKKRDLYIAKKR